MRLRLIHWLEKIMATLMALLVIDVIWQVTTRFILNNPSSFTDELARFLINMVGFVRCSLGVRS